MLLFQTHTIEDQTDSLAAYLPGGRLFESKWLPDKNFRNYLRGLAGELQRMYDILQTVATEHQLDITEQLLTEWERALGIPGTCFDNTGSNDIRRRNLLIKLAGLHGSTQEDFIKLARTLGYTVTMEPARVRGMFPLHFEAYFFTDGKTAMFTLILSLPPKDEPQGFTFGFPFKFTHPDNALLECLFNRIRPANVQVLYRYVSEVETPVIDRHGLILQDNSGALELENSSGVVLLE